MELLRKKNLLHLVVAFLAILLASLGAYFAGYRILDLKVVKVGSITLASVAAGTTIYLDGEETQAVRESGSVTIRGVLPGEHTVILGRDSYWPWSKEVRVESDAEEIVAPFAVPQSTNGIIIPSTNPRYEDIKKEVERATGKTYSASAPLLSADGTVALWTEGETIFARWTREGGAPRWFCKESCEEPVTVLTSSETPIRQISFFPGRNDVVLLATREGIFALEIHKEGTQNFQPLYKGIRPIFVETENGTLYVLDQEVLFEATL